MAYTLATGVKTATSLTLIHTDETPNRALVLPVMDVTFNPGYEVEETMVAQRSGIKTVLEIEAMSQNPQFTFTFPRKVPELLAARFNRRLETSGSVERYVSQSGFKVTGSGNYAAVTSGEFGYAIAADPTGVIASYLDSSTGESKAITVSTYAGFDQGTSTTAMGVGDNGALIFSNDLIGEYVTYAIPATYTGIPIFGSDTFNNFDMILNLYQTDGSILTIEAPVEFRLDQGDVNFNELPFELTVQVRYDGSKCEPITMSYLQELQSCVEPTVA